MSYFSAKSLFYKEKKPSILICLEIQLVVYREHDTLPFCFLWQLYSMEEKNQKGFIDLWTCLNRGVTNTFYPLGTGRLNVCMFNLQASITNTTNTGEETLLRPLSTSRHNECAHTHKCMLAGLASGTQIICSERTGHVV